MAMINIQTLLNKGEKQELFRTTNAILDFVKQFFYSIKTLKDEILNST